MRRRRLYKDDHINHEAWAIPYADLMTLLLAFFVVMYAVSVVNEGKYRVMSESIIEAFNGTSHVIAPMPPKPTKPLNVDPSLATPPGRPGAAPAPVAVPTPRYPSPQLMANLRGKPNAPERQNLERIQEQVQQALQPLIDRNLVVVRRTENWLEIEIRTDILFPSGVAHLSASAQQVLDRLSGILAPFPNPLRVEGYTDDKPINTAVYPSNWELSAARAASVVHLFAEHGVAPARLGIIGWGEYRPAADNATAEGRNRNRRVLVVVLSDDQAPARFFSTPEQKQAGRLPAPVQAGVQGAPSQGAPLQAGARPVSPPAVSSPTGQAGLSADAVAGIAATAAAGATAGTAGAAAVPVPAGSQGGSAEAAPPLASAQVTATDPMPAAAARRAMAGDTQAGSHAASHLAPATAVVQALHATEVAAMLPAATAAAKRRALPNPPTIRSADERALRESVADPSAENRVAPTTSQPGRASLIVTPDGSR
ncbi:flagellar motor protein MotD [Frateuria defendens]|uniref:flagellar motor protein MotD n=1 Tax=Frateuria defendens TaxID=2219559 RepID=UPI00069E3C70|nr:flagellar motor protein MotD [Frateuria defendens]